MGLISSLKRLIFKEEITPIKNYRNTRTRELYPDVKTSAVDAAHFFIDKVSNRDLNKNYYYSNKKHFDIEKLHITLFYGQAICLALKSKPLFYNDIYITNHFRHGNQYNLDIEEIIDKFNFRFNSESYLSYTNNDRELFDPEQIEIMESVWNWANDNIYLQRIWYEDSFTCKEIEKFKKVDGPFAHSFLISVEKIEEHYLTNFMLHNLGEDEES